MRDEGLVLAENVALRARVEALEAELERIRSGFDAGYAALCVNCGHRAGYPLAIALLGGGSPGEAESGTAAIHHTARRPGVVKPSRLVKSAEGSAAVFQGKAPEDRAEDSAQESEGARPPKDNGDPVDKWLPDDD